MPNLPQRCGDWLFSADPRRRVRASMGMLAFMLMLLGAMVLMWLAYAGYCDLSTVVWWCAVALGGQAVMVVLVRFGISERWSDPGLSLLQIIWSVTASATAYAIVGEAKAVVPGALAVGLLFAALSLKATQILQVACYTLLAMTQAVIFALQTAPQEQLKLEVAYAISVLVTIIGCMLLSLRLYELRMRLHKKHQELAAALAENRELATRDPLTGLLNRRHMLALLQLEQRRCLRGTCTMLLAQIDIDHFKAINDTYGHAVGDTALLAFSKVVSNSIRSSDVLARWGGEEFVLLLSDTNLEGALITLNRIRAAIQAATIEDGEYKLHMTASLGLAMHIPGEPLEATLARADKALYAAKRGGRNQVVVGETPTSALLAAAEPA